MHQLSGLFQLLSLHRQHLVNEHTGDLCMVLLAELSHNFFLFGLEVLLCFEKPLLSVLTLNLEVS